MRRLRVSSYLLFAMGIYLVAPLFFGESSLVSYMVKGEELKRVIEEDQRLRAERADLEHRYGLLADGRGSADYLEELAFRTAGLTNKDDILVSLDDINPAIARQASPLPQAVSPAQSAQN